MRIGIDASRAFGEQKTGTENYSFQMIKHLLALPESRKHNWVLYTKVPIAEFLAKNVVNNVISLPYLWTQVGLSVRTWVDELDVLWIPAHTLPVFRKPGLKTVVTIHGIEYEFLPAYENKLQRWYLPLSTRYAVHNASKLIAVSHFTAKQIEDRLEGDAKKVTVVYEGVANNKLQPRVMASNVLKKYGLTSKNYVVFVGTIQPRKNVKRLVEAYMGLNNIKTPLVLIGKLGWGFEDLPVDQHPNVKFLRYINDAERDILLQNALVYIQPSITEGFGLPVLEAYQAGVPVVSSHGGALAEVACLETSKTNVFDPYNLMEMQNILGQAITDNAWREELIAAGKVKLRQFSWKSAANMTYKILTNNC